MILAYLPAFAAFGGSAFGGLTTFAATLFIQRRKDSTRRRSQEKSRRQKLYKEFIEEASRLYADALVHDNSEISALVSLHALIGRMRILSSDAVIERAEAVARNDRRHVFCAEQDISRIAAADGQSLNGPPERIQPDVPQRVEWTKLVPQVHRPFLE